MAYVSTHIHKLRSSVDFIVNQLFLHSLRTSAGDKNEWRKTIIHFTLYFTHTQNKLATNPFVAILWMNSTDKIAIQIDSAYLHTNARFCRQKKFPLILTLTCLMTEFVFFFLNKKQQQQKNPIYSRERSWFLFLSREQSHANDTVYYL